MKKYINADIELINIKSEDIIMTSGDDTETPGESFEENIELPQIR